MNTPLEVLTFGWREWVNLPDLRIRQIKAKVDTGARTSALHAFEVRPYSEGGRDRVEFRIHPLQTVVETVVTCVADVLDKRIVTDSGGHKEERYVIETNLSIGDHSWPIEVTLTARDDMLFRMLLGRTAIKNRAQVDPARSYLVGKKKRIKESAKLRSLTSLSALATPKSILAIESISGCRSLTYTRQPHWACLFRLSLGGRRFGAVRLRRNTR